MAVSEPCKLPIVIVGVPVELVVALYILLSVAAVTVMGLAVMTPVDTGVKVTE